jgi:hypothetical protein
MEMGDLYAIGDLLFLFFFFWLQSFHRGVKSIPSLQLYTFYIFLFPFVLLSISLLSFVLPLFCPFPQLTFSL